MGETLEFIFTSLSISILFIILGLLFDAWLTRMGIIRGDKIAVIIIAIAGVFMKQIWFKDLSWWPWGLFMILALALSAHRGGLGETLKRGKWWWKQKGG